MLSIKLEEFIGAQNLDKIVELRDLLNANRLSAKDTKISNRVISHWVEKGIIHFSRSKENSNRRFSFVDFVWIKTVNELRSLGVKLPVIKKMAESLYQTPSVKELFDLSADHADKIFKNYEGENKAELIHFFQSGEYKKANIEDMNFNVTNLHMIIIEAIANRKSISLIVFNDGEWFPYVKENKEYYPDELLYKKEFHSQVRVNITGLINNYLIEDFVVEYLNGFDMFTLPEMKLLYYIKEGDYKKVLVLFRSRKQKPLEIVKSKRAQESILNILRKKEYREFIVTDRKDREFRIKGGQEDGKIIPIRGKRKPAKTATKA